MTQKSPQSKREYPVFYEKVVPIAIGLLTVVIVLTIIFTVLVGIGVLSFG